MADRIVARSAVLRWSVATLLLTVAVFSIAAIYGHDAEEEASSSVLVDPGPLTEWGLPISQVVGDGAGFVTIGFLLAAAFLLPAPSGTAQGHATQAVRHSARAATLWSVAIVFEMTFAVSNLFGSPAYQLSFAEISAYLTDSTDGRAQVVQLLLVIVVAVVSRWVLGVPALAGLLILAVAAFIPPALTGHSASAGAHMLAVASLLLHLVGAALWVGGLIALGWVATFGSKRLPAAVQRFSVLAVWCIAIVGISGVVNAAIRIEHPSQILSTAYGNLLLGKVIAIVALGAFGWFQRQRAIPQLRADGVGRRFITLAATEIIIMLATIALAVALSRTPPPVPDDLYTDPVTELLGEPMPAALTVRRLLTELSPSGFGIAIVALGSAFYIAGLVILRRRGDRWPIGRTFSWFIGMALIGWATFGGIGAYANVLFSMHMVAHMVLSMVAPIFLVLAAPITLALRTLPGPREPGEIAPRQLLTRALHSRIVRLLTHPVIVSVLFVASLYALYFTDLFTLLMETHTGHAVMLAHFILVGSLFFYVLVGIDPSPRRLAPLIRFGILMVTMPFHAFFSVAIMSYDRVLGEAYWSQLDRPYRTDLLADQNLGGSMSWAMGELPLLIVMLALFVQWFRSDRRESRRIDRRDDSDLEAYNAYLAALHKNEQQTSRER